MSLATSLGPQSLVQLGISLADISQIYKIGQKVGNWIMIKRNDEDMFETLMEDHEALLKRKGIVEPSRMESMFPDTQFIYHGDRVTTSNKDIKMKHEGLRPFSWLMVVVVSALRHCLPKSKIIDLLVLVFTTILDNEAAESALRANLGVNVESWRSAGQVRGINNQTLFAFRKVWKEKTGGDAFSELNRAERLEMVEFLVFLMGNTSSNFTYFSVATYSMAKALESCKIYIKTGEKGSCEGLLFVNYAPDSFSPDLRVASEKGKRLYHRTIESQAQIVSLPSGDSKSMVQAARASRPTTNRMECLWYLGAKAAQGMSFLCTAEYPYSTNSQVQYSLGENWDPDTQRFDTYISIIAQKAFPRANQSILEGIEMLVSGYDKNARIWLESHAGLEYLLKSQAEVPDSNNELLELWLTYQALVFGFYYRLFEPLVSHELVSNSTAYYCGLWGHGSTTFLAMCSQFGNELKKNRTVGQTHVLHMLATMYAGRNKIFLPDHSRTNLVGVLGSISILTRSLLRPTDNPEDMGQFFILDLPVVHLAPNEDGELYAAVGHSLEYRTCKARKRDVQPRGPMKKRTVHSSMSTAFREGNHGVVMAARCGERLVGWFSPTAADTMFLSEAYCSKRHDDDSESNFERCSVRFEVSDEDWQKVHAKRVAGDEEETVGLVHSLGCPALRYAAAGFYGEIGDELAIATDDVEAAIGRVQLANSDIVIT